MKSCIPAFAVTLVLLLLSGGDSFSSGEMKEHPDSAKSRRIPDVMFIPTPPDVVHEMLKLAKVCKDDVVYDLGCGDGRIVVAAARQYGCRAVGIDIDPLRVKQARQRVRDNHVEHLVKIEQGDLFSAQLNDATVITLYLSTKYNTRLIPQLNQAKPGARVVSHLFGIKGIEADASVEVVSKADRRKHKLMLWKTPLRNEK